MFEPPAMPPAGWYPDPVNPGAHRWWDGAAWAPSLVEPRSPDQLPDIGELISGSFKVMWRRWRALTTVAVLTTAPAVALSTVALEHLTDGLVYVERDERVIGWSSDRLTLVVVLLVASAVLSLVSSIAAARLMIDTVDQRRSTSDFGDEARAAVRALGAALRVIPRFVGWAVLVILAVTLAIGLIVLLTVVALPLGIVLMIAMLPLGVWLGVKLAFVGIAIVDRGGNPFSRSWSVARQRFWGTFGRLLLIGGVAYGASTAANMPISLVNSARFGNFASEPSFIEVDEGGVVESIDFGSLFDVSWWSLSVSILVAIALGVVVGGFFNAAFVAMYRTRNARQA